MTPPSADPSFQPELDAYLRDYVGRPSPLWFAERLTKVARRREGLLQARRAEPHRQRTRSTTAWARSCWPRRMGKTRIIAETGAGQHGVATATVCALFGLPCTIYMGATDVERQKPNVFRMKLLGAECRPRHLGRRHAQGCDERGAARLGRQRVDDTYYLIGTVAGPHPYPGHGARLPEHHRHRGARADAGCARAACRTLVVAAIGGGSNAMGLFHPFLDDIVGQADRRRSRRATGSRPEVTPPACRAGGPACCMATAPTCCRTSDGQIAEAHSISAGLDYPGHRAGAFLAARDRPGGICCRHRPGGARRLPALHQHGGHHPRAGARACPGACAARSPRRWGRTPSC